MNEYKVGDKFRIGSNLYILALTSDWKDKFLLHFQLIDMLTGNRYSDKVVTHDSSIHSGLSLDKNEMEYMIDEYPQLTEAILATRKKGPAWEEDPVN